MSSRSRRPPVVPSYRRAMLRAAVADDAMAHVSDAHSERQPDVALTGDDNIHDDSHLGEDH
ncbi:hypothetical protein ACGFYP_34315 [Streptomyces sp. NPDC048370]|uniref:hypothetical protein n=1 Tax=Streptomyces sp. NPDC048370 TaxID=3365540 RepID=UPI00371F7817